MTYNLLQPWLFCTAILLFSRHVSSDSVVIKLAPSVETSPLDMSMEDLGESTESTPCAASCRPNACDGPSVFDCTACDPPKTLSKANANDTKGLCKICAEVCAPGQCVGHQEDNADCLACAPGRKLVQKEGQEHGSCIKCDSNCAECVDTGDDDCTACSETRVLVKRLNHSAGVCTSCVDTCAFMQCVGQGGDECTACQPGLILQPKPRTNQTMHLKEHGQCVQCVSTCSHMQCIGPGSSECTKCYPGRALVPATPTLSADLQKPEHGTCEKCAENCLLEHCIGENTGECTACPANITFYKLGEKQGADHGMCLRCHESCALMKCLGASKHECVECPETSIFAPVNASVSRNMTNGTSQNIVYGQCISPTAAPTGSPANQTNLEAIALDSI